MHSRCGERTGPPLCVCCLLTGLNFECEGVLLLDGVCEVEASVAAVVSVSIFDQNVGEVQVPVQTHGHSLILRDRGHSWRRRGGQRGDQRGMEKRNVRWEIINTFGSCCRNFSITNSQ